MLVALAAIVSASPRAAARPSGTADRDDDRAIEHLIVIYQENVSFDHYFATYPKAANPSGKPAFHARPGTPSVNGLNNPLLHANPNATQPFRLDRSQIVTCDQNHDYMPEQQAFDKGLMDKFVEFAGTGSGKVFPGNPSSPNCDARVVMGYFDGNTVTALWNYAQHFAMSDNSFSTQFGPSTPGALNLVAGQTHGATPSDIPDETVAGTVIGDPRPGFDDCSSGVKVTMTGTNIGNLLNAKNVTWGWFQGGFRPTSFVNGKAVCGATHIGSNGQPKGDYIPHHEPFQYYLSTANPHHLPPSSTAMIGRTDQANHQYDLIDFWLAAAAGNLPAVGFLKAPGYQDGHAAYSDPLAEQHFLVETINQLQRLPEWDRMAVIIAYDDSDGWYDHVMGPIVSQSQTAYDALTGVGQCGTSTAGPQGPFLPGRCGYGPRQPLLLISPFAKINFVDSSVTDQASILRFTEDNWQLGRIGGGSFDAIAGSLRNMLDFSRSRRAPRLFLDPTTGQPIDDGGPEDRH